MKCRLCNNEIVDTVHIFNTRTDFCVSCLVRSSEIVASLRRTFDEINATSCGGTARTNRDKYRRAYWETEGMIRWGIKDDDGSVKSLNATACG